MGGAIGVNSTPGEGSEFWFTLPATEAKPVSESFDSTDLNGVSILLVENRPTAEEAIRNQLKQWPVKLHSCSDVQSALRALKESINADEPFDLVLVDESVPDADALVIARMISANPEIRDIKIALAASSTEDNIAELAGIDYRIQKPILRHRLWKCLVESRRQRPITTVVLADTAVEKAEVDGHARVLLAEDNPVNQEVARGMLVSFGCDVKIAVNGQAAVELVRTAEFDVVLMDCQMPVMDGYEATREIRGIEARRSRGRIPIMAITANAQPEDRGEMHLGGHG